MPATSVTTYHLEMLDPRDLRPKRSSRGDVTLSLVNPPMPELNRFFYTAVGADWYWLERLPWTFADWQTLSPSPQPRDLDAPFKARQPDISNSNRRPRAASRSAISVCCPHLSAPALADTSCRAPSNAASRWSQTRLGSHVHAGSSAGACELPGSRPADLQRGNGPRRSTSATKRSLARRLLTRIQSADFADYADLRNTRFKSV